MSQIDSSWLSRGLVVGVGFCLPFSWQVGADWRLLSVILMGCTDLHGL